MIRILQFAKVVNRHDFIDVLVQHADRRRFELGVCLGTEECNVAAPEFSAETPRWVVPWTTRRTLHAAAWRLARILRAWRADILHTHHYDEALIGWLATRLHRRTRLVVGRHYSDSLYRLPSRLKRGLLLRLERLANDAAARIVVPSTFIQKLLADRQRTRCEKIDVIPYAVVPEKYPRMTDSEIHELRAAHGLAGRIGVGIFGRIDGQKGHDVLIEALAALRTRCPEVRAIVVGDGPLRADLERQIRQRQVADIVELVGWRRDVLRLMAAVDLVVQPTRQEAFSQVMVEALWLGKPLAITDVSGVSDVIEDGTSGLVIPREDPPALAATIERLAGDAGLRSALGAAGRAAVSDRLSVHRVVPRYEQSWLQVLA